MFQYLSLEQRFSVQMLETHGQYLSALLARMTPLLQFHLIETIKETSQMKKQGS